MKFILQSYYYTFILQNIYIYIYIYYAHNIYTFYVMKNVLFSKVFR